MIMTMVTGFEGLAKGFGYTDLRRAGLRLLDFANAPEESCVSINDWVSEQRESRTKDLSPRGGIGELTHLVLANAI